MNSKITSFNFENCSKLNKIYISPDCEVEGKIILFDSPINKGQKNDEYEEGKDGVIYTSESILNNVKLEKGNWKEKYQKDRTEIEKLTIEITKKR